VNVIFQANDFVAPDFSTEGKSSTTSDQEPLRSGPNISSRLMSLYAAHTQRLHPVIERFGFDAR